MSKINFLSRIIEISFYGLFFLVPLIFTNNTSELFEFNKLWITFVLTIVIGASWLLKMVLTREFKIQRTPLDIPILLFLAALVLSTIFSWDPHVSLWGYYSRFNGGLFSMISYIFLYYAFVSNFWESPNRSKIIWKSLMVSLLSGLITALWGFPAHFGYDPTCLIFRGHLDVACWTSDFQPKVRIFSTLGQPDWLAAYLAILLPITAAFGIKVDIEARVKGMKNKLLFGFYVLLFALFYADLLFTRSRSGILAFLISFAVWILLLFWVKKKQGISKFVRENKNLGVFVVLVVVVSFLIGIPVARVEKISLPGLISAIHKTQVKTSPIPSPVASAGELGGTDSGKIRLLVWRGALNAWRHNPIFGTGVETFAYSYYMYKPVGHNLTSEWNFLYNKAHNEFLNYLATTGILGFSTYLLMIGLFLSTIKILYLNLKKGRIYKAYAAMSRTELSDDAYKLAKEPLVLALVASYLSILITNFFGFSVVITNIYLFIIPALVLMQLGVLGKNKLGFGTYQGGDKISPIQVAGTAIIVAVALFLLYFLKTSWSADTSYALGYNFDQIRQYQEAYPYLTKAVALRPGEPVFKDELSLNEATLAYALVAQGASDSAQVAQNLAQTAVNTSNDLTKSYPKNVVFWKSKVRIFYTLAQVDPNYLSPALDAVKNASALAPNDANINYNLGVLYGQNGDSKKAIEVLEKTVAEKPDYPDARYALGIFYHDLAVDKNGKVVNKSYQNKAVAQMQYLLKISPDDSQTKDALSAWTGK